MATALPAKNKYRILLCFIVHLPNNPYPQAGRMEADVDAFPAAEEADRYRELVLEEIGIAEAVAKDSDVVVAVRPVLLEVNGLPIFPAPTDKDGIEIQL